MKKYLLISLIIVGMYLTTCGNEPPAEFYWGTPEDSTAIHSIINDDYPELLITDDIFTGDYVFVDLPAVEFTEADNFFRTDSPLIKQHADSCGLELSELNRVLDFWFAKDTTCTVYLYDTFTIFSLTHGDVKYTAHYDSALIDTLTGETLSLVLKTIDTLTASFTHSKTSPGYGLRHIFFEPERDTVPTVDEETGDTTYKFFDPLEWELKRISYGTYYYPQYGTDLPIIDQVVLITGERRDTIFRYETDTLFIGHAMNRFRHIDSILVYSASVESLDVSITLAAGGPEVAEVSFFASCAGSDRAELASGIGEMRISGSGIVNLYFEAVWKDSYYYINPDKGYKSTVWLIPVQLGGG
jgi:hypothetical protein